MSGKRQLDFGSALGDIYEDKLQLDLLLKALEDFDAEEPVQNQKKNTSVTNRIGDSDRNRTNIQDLINRDDLNFNQELDYERGKSYRSMKPYQPPKFRILGYNQQGKPIFKFSDLFLTSDIKLKGIIDKYFNDIIHGSKNTALETGELSKKNQKGYDFGKLIQNWEKKQYEDFTNDKKNKMDQKELEQIVVNRGDSKNNYWIYKVGQRRKYDYQDIYEHRNKKQISQTQQQEYFNQNLLNPRFSQNMHKAADRIRLQYAKIEQFESDEDKVQNNDMENQNEQEFARKYNKADSQQTQAYQFWGQINSKNTRQQVPQVINEVKMVIVQDQIKDVAVSEMKKEANKKNSNIMTDQNELQGNTTFVDSIIKDYSVMNHEIVNNSYKGKETMNEYNRIQFHLENPNFFLTKLHYALQKKSEQFSNFVQKGQLQLEKGPSHLQSIISGSRVNPTVDSWRDGPGAEDDPDDPEIIEGKIAREMSLQSKKPINHSDVATKLHFIKFSNELDNFKNYHRYELKFDLLFAKKTKIRLMRNLKPLKCKGTDFNINAQKKDSYTKFSKPESLSLASEQMKEFIMIQYIQENPLLMSDVGMCQRMMLQVNNKQMLQKVNKDIIEDMEIQAYEEIRDNPANNQSSNTSTQHKMELWRKNIKNHFGENGKVYLWEPERQSKLIGNPDGVGVAIMESNLAAMPVVKKTPNKRDFLLVREIVRQGNKEVHKWVLRKIDSVYVSGQVEPKQVVFSPGDRPYQTFLEKYQMDFLTKVALNTPSHRISIQIVKNAFPNTPQTSAQSRIRKMLKKMSAQTKDNKSYQLKIDDEDVKFKLEPEQFCLYQRMQKSLCQLESVGITHMKNMQKMKSILRKYFKKTQGTDQDKIENFATARMVRDQLQLTSWYLTESFRKFIDKNARIEMIGHADPTNGHGGYSFIKKPQKERTDKDEAQQKQEKNKLSGTEYDLRKLKVEESVSLLEKLGYSRQSLVNCQRWELVTLLKNQKDTEYSRKQRESKDLKEQNERKQRSKALNNLLRYLRNEQQGLIEAFDYDFNPYLDLSYYINREKANWETAKQKLKQRLSGEDNQENDQDDEDQD